MNRCMLALGRGLKSWWFGAFCLLLFLLMLGWQAFFSQKMLALLPWGLLLLHRQALSGLRQIARAYPLAVIATLLLSGWIFFVQFWHGFERTEIRQALAYLVWIPVAAMGFTVWRSGREWVLSAQTMLVLAQMALLAALLIDWLYMRNPRPDGLNHNVLVGSLVLTQSFLLIMLRRLCPDQYESRMLMTSGLLLAIAIALLTGARSPLVALILGGLFVSMIVDIGLPRRMWFVMFSVIIIWIIILRERFAEIAVEVSAYWHGERFSSMGGRFDAWRWIVEHIDDHLWLGWSVDGLKRSLAVRGALWDAPTEQLLELPHLHHDAMQLLIAYGLPAGLAFALFMIGLIAPTIRRLRAEQQRNPSARVRGALFLWLCLIIVIAGQSDSLMYWPANAVAFQAILGMGAALAILSSAVEPQNPHDECSNDVSVSRTQPALSLALD